ncbi:hypothetical protein ScPMuIL_001160 [Solemya velum]
MLYNQKNGEISGQKVPATVFIVVSSLELSPLETNVLALLSGTFYTAEGSERLGEGIPFTTEGSERLDITRMRLGVLAGCDGADNRRLEKIIIVGLPARSGAL